MLAIKFPKGKEDVTAFKRTYNKLMEKKVTFPNDYKFISINLPKGEGMGDSKR